MFMSRNALNGTEAQTCLDDLESFYYVLFYISRIHVSPESAGRSLPHPFESWERPNASVAKFAFLFSRFKYTTDPRLGKPFQILVERLHSVFRNVVVQAFLADGRDEPPPIVNHEEIYDMMLAHVRDAIEDLNQELQDGITTPNNSGHGVGTKEVPSERFSWIENPRVPKRKKIVRTLAANRARRSRQAFR